VRAGYIAVLLEPVLEHGAASLSRVRDSSFLVSAGASESQGVRGTVKPSVTLAPFEFAVVVL
jgi:hypothetical protein